MEPGGKRMAEVIEGLRIGFVDCESTGIGPDDEPISIGVVVVKLDAKGYGEPFAEWYGEQEPSVPIHPKAAKVHGKTAADLAGKRFDRAGLRAIMEQADILVAHHASFDARMLLKVEPETLDWEWRCSRRQWVWPVMGDKKLDTVCKHFGIERPATHDALADAHVLRLALMQRTGKTERSRVYMHRLMYRGECDVRPRAPRASHPREGWDPRWEEDGYRPQGLEMRSSSELKEAAVPPRIQPAPPERPRAGLGQIIGWSIAALVMFAALRACAG